jgi:hypothetical protein
MKKLFLILTFNFCFSLSYGQTTELYVGSDANSFVIKANQSVTFSTLTLTPTLDLDLTNKQVVKASSVVNTVTQPYIPLVYRFNSAVTNYSGSVVIDYNGVTITNFNENNFLLHYYNGSNWTRDASSSVDVNANTVTRTGFSGITLSELTISDVPTTLPVTWQSFTAEKQGTASLLKWSTASEQNTKDFEVQHSTNTLSWTPLGTLAAAGNSTTTRQYSFTHATPFKGNVYNYYRILQRDLDGKFSYSKIASLIYDEPGPDVFVYPNPAKEAVTVYLAESQDVRLINVAGATVWKGTLSAGRNQIPLTHLAKGVYWVVTGSVKKQLLIQ